MKVKYNNGNPVIVCEHCNSILGKYHVNSDVENNNNDDYLNYLHFCNKTCANEYLRELEKRIIIYEPDGSKE